jgi:hypothetical protein
MKIYNDKANEHKLIEVKKEIKSKFYIQEYIINEISIKRGGTIFDDNEKYFNTNEYVKYKYSIKSNSDKDSFELTIIEHSTTDEYNYTSYIEIKRIIYVRNSEVPYLKIFTKNNDCDFFLNSILFDPLRRDNDELINLGFYNSDLLYLDPIKLIHEKYQGVEDFYYCEKV